MLITGPVQYSITTKDSFMLSAIRLTAAVFAWALCSCTPEAQDMNETSPQVFIYDSTDSNIAEAYDTTSSQMTVGQKDKIQDLSYRQSQEFQGPILRCDTREVHCMMSGLIVAVPVVQDPGARWGTSQVQCELISIDADRIVTAACSSNGTPQVIFRFSHDLGILSYRRTCPQCDGAEFRVRGSRGLFHSTRSAP